MTVIDDAQYKNVHIQIKNGELNFSIQLIDFKGFVRPFIIRTLKLSGNSQSTKTEQHTLIHSAAELDDWIAQDSYSTHHPESFLQVKDFASKAWHEKNL